MSTAVRLAAGIGLVVGLGAACSDPKPTAVGGQTPPAAAAGGGGAAVVPAAAGPVEASAPQPAPAGPAAEAAAIYEQRCVMCHGKTGLGDGVAAAALQSKPRNYTDAAWQATVADDYLAKVIVQGGGGVGKSALMPANADLESKAEVVAKLVQIIRRFAKP